MTNRYVPDPTDPSISEGPVDYHQNDHRDRPSKADVTDAGKTALGALKDFGVALTGFVADTINSRIVKVTR